MYFLKKTYIARYFRFKPVIKIAKNGNWIVRNSKNGLRKAVLISFLSFYSIASFAQWVNPDHKQEERYPGFKTGWYAGADFGSTLFYGDVTLYNNFPKLKDFKKSSGNGYSFYGGKKFRYGLIAEAQAFKGTLTGMKIADKLYPRYFDGEIMEYSVNFKYNLSQELFRSSQQRKFFNRLTVYVTAGAGQAFFRSRLYKLALNNQWYLEKANGYTSTGIDSAGIGKAGGLVVKKATPISAITMPIGGKINFKLNSVTDIALDLRYVTVFSDKLDGWERSWSHYDKYLYMGVGLVFNFGKKGEEDVPNSQRFMKHEPTDTGASDDIDSELKSGKRGLFNRKSKKSKADKDLELRLKMYELQLKLFEMQYLQGG